MASKKDFRVVKSFFAAWVESDGKVRIIINDQAETATWKTKAAAKKAVRQHWARPEVFMAQGRYLKPGRKPSGK